MQQSGDEGPRLQMWLGSIRQDQKCSSLCLGMSGGGREGSRRQRKQRVKNGKHYLSRCRGDRRAGMKTAAVTEV